MSVTWSDDPLGSPSSDDDTTALCTNITVKKFIEQLEQLPQLWDTTHPYYTLKNKRNEACDRLLTTQKQWMPNATREDVRKKINSLKSNFRKELKKIELSKQSGSDEVYKPRSWTFKALLFLVNGDKTNRNDSFNSSSDLSENTPNGSIITYIDPEDIQPQQKKKKNIVKHEPEMHEHECQPVSQRQEQNTLSMDPLALVWTRKLNSMNPTQRLYCEKFINDIIFEAQCNNLHRNSVQINIQPSGSTPHSEVNSPDQDDLNTCTPIIVSPNILKKGLVIKSECSKNGTI